MKTRHVVAIGILTAIAVGLLAIGIKYTGQKPKVQQTSAYYDVKTYNYNTKAFTIEGYTTEGFEILNADKDYNTIAASKYTINYNGANTYVSIETQKFTNIEYEEWYLTNPLITEFNFTTTKPKNISITQEIIEEEIIIYTIKINNQTKSTRTLITDPQITIYNSEPIETEYATFQQTINLIDYEYETAYTTGYQTKGDLADGNFLSIQETMLNVLTMPFTFISQGFNVTLWEGTPYQINIGNFIKSLIAIATILFIIKMFTSGFSVIGNYTSGTGANISQWRKNRSERKLNESKARLNDRTNPNHKTRDSHVTIKKEN